MINPITNHIKNRIQLVIPNCDIRYRLVRSPNTGISDHSFKMANIEIMMEQIANNKMGIFPINEVKPSDLINPSGWK